jgi:hypothetical protein
MMLSSVQSPVLNPICSSAMSLFVSAVYVILEWIIFSNIFVMCWSDKMVLISSIGGNAVFCLDKGITLAVVQ